MKFKDLSRISRIGMKFEDFKDFIKDEATLVYQKTLALVGYHIYYGNI